jgi:hypothetical protein
MQFGLKDFQEVAVDRLRDELKWAKLEARQRKRNKQVVVLSSPTGSGQDGHYHQADRGHSDWHR